MTAPSSATYARRVFKRVATLSRFGGIATLAALNLPKAAMTATSPFDVKDIAHDQDNALANACVKGAMVVCLVPVALVCAAACLGATVLAHLIYVHYVMGSSWNRRPLEDKPWSFEDGARA